MRSPALAAEGPRSAGSCWPNSRCLLHAGRRGEGRPGPASLSGSAAAATLPATKGFQLLSTRSGRPSRAARRLFPYAGAPSPPFHRCSPSGCTSADRQRRRAVSFPPIQSDADRSASETAPAEPIGVEESRRQSTTRKARPARVAYPHPRPSSSTAGGSLPPTKTAKPASRPSMISASSLPRTASNRRPNASLSQTRLPRRPPAGRHPLCLPSRHPQPPCRSTAPKCRPRPSRHCRDPRRFSTLPLHRRPLSLTDRYCRADRPGNESSTRTTTRSAARRRASSPRRLPALMQASSSWSARSTHPTAKTKAATSPNWL